MVELPSARQLAALVTITGLMLAGGAVFLTATQGDMLGPIFQYVLTGNILLGLVVWIILALASRRLVVGKLPKKPLTSMPALLWGGTRIVLLIAVASLIAMWLAALALGLAIETALLRALVLLVVVTGFTGVISGAFYNSILVARRWRGDRN